MYCKHPVQKIFLCALLFFAAFSVKHAAHAGTLTCSVVASCPSGTVIYRMSSTTNAHAELPGQSNYAQLVCCSGVTGLGTSCAGTFATVLKLAATTNAHSEQNGQANYGTNACISVPGGGSVSVGYQASNCSGFDTTLGSLSGTTNAHVGDVSAYSTKICATAVGGAPQSLTASISDNSIGFGTLASGAARYATGDTSGAASDVADAHTISVSTNAESGYTMTLSGSTLTCSGCGGATVNAIGGTPAASSPGTEQFGLRAIVNSGTGSASAPYNGSSWALDAAAFPDIIASGTGDAVTTTFGLRYIGNIAAGTETGSYSAVLTYTVTATF